MHILNAHQNNLKNIDLNLSENQLIVVTGLSGSGKSSLAMDVIGNEGMRYFLESLPGYNQQNGFTIPTAEVDEIRTLPPVIKVEQSKRFQSVNSTFGTLSELTDIFRVLFARYATKKNLSKSLFSFNHPKGACEMCRGIGEAEYIDLTKLIDDKHKTLREGAIVTTLPSGYIVYSQVTLEELNKVCKAHGFTVDIPWEDLTPEQQDVVLNGSNRRKVFYGKHSLESRLRWKGIKAKPREEGFYKGILPIMEDILKRDRNPNILKFTSAKLCPSCHGGRIKAEHLKYKWKELNFQTWMELSLQQLRDRLQSLKFNSGEEKLVEKLYSKLTDFIRLGMADYQLSTPSTAISSGDAQRIKLINRVNGKLQGILYIFDEPSIGLSTDYQRYLLHILHRLILRGNTVMVVEHDLDFIQAADWIVELGPKAGINGGEIIFTGSVKKFLTTENLQSPTRTALDEIKNCSRPQEKPAQQRATSFQPEINKLMVIRQKSSKIIEVIQHFCRENKLQSLIINDHPIGKTPRSNPATYTGLAHKIRNLFAKTPRAKILGLTKSAFSFNSKIGRCETCHGAGVITLSMSIWGTVNQVCPTCRGKRFKAEVLQADWRGKNIAETYSLSVEEAYTFFTEEKKIKEILALMLQLGLGYLKLGQPSNTLSGGEAQRLKLTKHFAKKSKKTLLLLEEPSIGLHHKNVKQLLKALQQLKRETAGIICFENHTLFQTNCDLLVDNLPEIQSLEIKEEAQQQRDAITIHGARTHSLKNLNIAFPKQRLTVVTGISGSGKSSLVIDTLHGFGLQEMTKQFSSYQQSRVGINFQLKVNEIQGLTPTICITRKQKNYAPRTDIAKQVGIDKVLRFAFSRKAQFKGHDLSASHFSNQHKLGRCGICEGHGQELLPDFNKIILDESKSIVDGLFMHNKAVGYYGDPVGKHMAILSAVGEVYGFTLETPFKNLNQTQQEIILHGTDEKVWEATWHYQTKTRKGTQDLKMKWEGIFNYLREEYFQTRKNKNIQKLTALFSYQKCSHCQGSGLKPERLSFQIAGKSIHEIKAMDFKILKNWLSQHSNQKDVDGKLLSKMESLLSTTILRAQQLHIAHLQLHRKSTTLSGGENQRVELIKQLNSPLKGITYLLDEPSAGLSHQNIPDLLQILQELINKGNTVILIEHNKEIILAADYLVELGPLAGVKGGYLTFQGSPQEFIKQDDCHPFLKTPTPPLYLKPGKTQIEVQNLAKHSLVRKTLQIPVGGVTAISGPSGIGKTTLVKDILMSSITNGEPVNCTDITFPKSYTAVQYFEPQKLRSHKHTILATYLNLLRVISKIFATETGLKNRDFSYKNKKSQCPNCKGKGILETSLDIVSNVIEECEVCKGQRYRPSILKYRVNSKNIAEVLTFSLEELRAWLPQQKRISKTLQLLKKLEEIGLLHLHLDQPVQSLSSGEKQRLLLLDWLQNQVKDSLYILDEPSIGLHYSDIDRLYAILKKLSVTNDILVIDHNPYLLEKIKVGLILKEE